MSHAFALTLLRTSIFKCALYIVNLYLLNETLPCGNCSAWLNFLKHSSTYILFFCITNCCLLSCMSICMSPSDFLIFRPQTIDCSLGITLNIGLLGKFLKEQETSVCFVSHCYWRHKSWVRVSNSAHLVW